jgi:hypothetical protein
MRFGDFYRDPRQTSRWKKLRAAVKAEHPRCEVQGCNNLAEHVHHIVPVTDPVLGLAYAFRWDNVRAVCAGCHPAADRGDVAWKPRSKGAPPGAPPIA